MNICSPKCTKRGVKLTEAEHDVEEDDEQHRDGVDGVAGRAHPEGTLRDVLAAGEEVRSDGQRVGDGREDDEGADEVREGGLAAELDGAEGGAEGGREDGGGDGAAELLVDSREEGGEGRRVVAGQGPPDASDLDIYVS